jgi:membrane protease YdiL (CAAX protease family)
MNEFSKERREMSLKEKLSFPEANEPPWNLLSALLTVFAMFICLAIIGPAFVAITATSAAPTPFKLMLSWSIGMALTTGFVLISRRSSDESWRALQLQKGNLPLPLVLLYGVAIGLSVGLLVSLASRQFLPIPEILGLLRRAPSSVIVAALLLILLQPVAETLVFQGVILPTLRWRLGPWGGVIFTSGLFTAIHLLVFSAATLVTFWYGIVYPALIGLAFCLLKVLTTSTRAVIIARMGAGLIFLLTALALVSG